VSVGQHILWTMARQSVAVGMRLGFTLLVARALGPAANGQYALAMLVPNLLTATLNLGVPAANAHYIARGALGLDAALRWNARFWLSLLLTAALGSLALGPFVDRLLPGVPPSQLLWSGGLFAIMLATTLLSGVLLGLNAFVDYNRALLIAPLLSLLIGIGLWASGHMQVVPVLAGQLATELIALAYIAARLRAFRSAQPPGAPNPRPSTRQLLTFGGASHASTVLMQINYRVDLYLVNLFLGPAAAGVYYIAARMAEQLWIVSQSASAVLLPTLSARTVGVEDTAARAVRLTLWAALGSGLVLLASVELLVKVLFGAKYAAASGVVALLLPGVLLLSGARVACVAMSARGRPELNIYMSVAIFVLNVGLNVLLVPVLGARGAALATSCAYGVGAVISLVLLARLDGRPLAHFVVLSRADLASLRAFVLRPRSPL
jgi:O-antigen/teichoic acid export membrane protein